MTVASDPSLTYLLVEDPETVTLRAKTGEGTYTTQTVPFAKRHQADRGQSDALGVETATFTLWRANLAGTTPLAGYEIVGADGTEWAIESVGVCSHRERFRCTCTRIR